MNGYTAKELKEAAIVGEEFFWSNPEKPWRKPYYEKYVKRSFQDFIKEQIRAALSEKKRRVSKQGGVLRDMQMQSDIHPRPASQGGKERE